MAYRESASASSTISPHTEYLPPSLETISQVAASRITPRSCVGDGEVVDAARVVTSREVALVFVLSVPTPSTLCASHRVHRRGDDALPRATRPLVRIPTDVSSCLRRHASRDAMEARDAICVALRCETSRVGECRAVIKCIADHPNSPHASAAR